jgi:hypothetical protein
MKFFLAFMVAGFLLSLYFLLTDEPGSGMGWGLAVFGGLGIGGAILEARRKKSLNDKAGKQ